MSSVLVLQAGKPFRVLDWGMRQAPLGKTVEVPPYHYGIVWERV